MSTAIDIDRLVREVIERLKAIDAAAQASPAPSDAAVIEARVVTLAAIEGRLNGVRRVILPAGAVVTPAVKDELQRRGIGWEFGKPKEKTESNDPPRLLLAATRGCDAAPLAKAGGRVEAIPGGELDEALARLGDAIIERSSSERQPACCSPISRLPRSASPTAAATFAPPGAWTWRQPARRSQRSTPTY
jgi:hypothetical protein